MSDDQERSRMPRVSTGSNTSSSPVNSIRLASISSLISVPQSPHTPSQTLQTPLTTAGSSDRPRKRSIGELESSREAQPDITSPNSAPGQAPYPCICQPEPKIPRPRNAFILYRQHHNADVIARHPQLSNPDISKIIGELWRNETEDVKQKWKDFAEADKLHHQQKYPDYRYQPKRSGKSDSGSNSSPSPWTDNQVCSKCNGYKVAQAAPSTSTSQRSSEDIISPEQTTTLPRRSNTITLPPPKPSAVNTPSTRYLPMQNLSLESPASARYPDRGFGTYSLPTTDIAQKFNQLDSPKRRRVDLQSVQSPTFFQSLPPSAGVGPMPARQSASSQGRSQGRRTSLSPASVLDDRAGYHAAAQMPQRGVGYGQHRSATRGGRDPSLNLPPLRTNYNAHPQSAIGSALPSASMFPAQRTMAPLQTAGLRGFELQTPRPVTSLDLFKHKLHTLRQLLTPCPEAAASIGRGAIVAVEGQSAVAAREVADWLGEHLRSSDSIDLTMMNGPSLPAEGQIRTEHLLDCVKTWHANSQDIIDTVVRPTNRRRSMTPGSAVLQRHFDTEMGDDMHSSQRKPVLVLRSYVLTATNSFAQRIQLTGNYDPQRHWEWTACMWRGIIAPDVVVYVKDAEPGGESGNGVDVYDEGRVIVIRRKREKGKEKEDVEGRREKSTFVDGVDDKALRRLGFELEEWLRDFSGLAVAT